MVAETREICGCARTWRRHCRSAERQRLCVVVDHFWWSMFQLGELLFRNQPLFDIDLASGSMRVSGAAADTL